MSSNSGKKQSMEPEEASKRFDLTTGESLYSASMAQPIVLIFMRHFGCTFTRQTLRGLEGIMQEAKENDAKLALVHMLKNGEEIKYFGKNDPVARIADPKCELYRSFGLGKGGLVELFGPKVWVPGITALLKGCGVGYFAGSVLQMPGSFVFHKGKIIAAKKAESAADQPDLQQLFKQAYSTDAF